MAATPVGLGRSVASSHDLAALQPDRLRARPAPVGSPPPAWALQSPRATYLRAERAPRESTLSHAPTTLRKTPCGQPAYLPWSGRETPR
eukprot:14117091-Alexandrium_andersonii.AAC.1